MVENPNILLKSKRNGNKNGSSENSQLSAIYITFYERTDFLEKLIEELRHIEQPIYIVESKIKTSFKDYNISSIDFTKLPIYNEISKLSTFNKLFNYKYLSTWDLPEKRNSILWHSVINEHKNILLLDDDMYNISPILNNVKFLHKYGVVGTTVKGFPDTSVTGQIEIENGEKFYPFISGNSTFINTDKLISYFPKIYNEDWLFYIPYILSDSLFVTGEIFHRQYDPFLSIEKIYFQEFGEIIQEGLYHLINENEYDKRFVNQKWHEIIQLRLEYLNDDLIKAKENRKKFVQEAINTLKRITSIECVNFVTCWEEDNFKFSKLLKNG